MTDNELIIYKNIVADMNEGVLVIDMSGKITSINTACLRILRLDDSIIGSSFAKVFFTRSENDSFNQAILDAIYENTVSHNTMVDYYDGEMNKKLFMNTSFLRNEDEKIGVIAVINDITELDALKDEIKTMNQIKALNHELERRNAFIRQTFGHYLSEEIVTEILDVKGGIDIGGKKQCVSILFSDIRSFTAISEEMEAHALISMLNSYLSHMIPIIQRNKGTILEFIGDAIVAVFGAPIESSNSDRDAVTCAVEMQLAMEEINALNISKGYPSIEMGIGIHNGDVVIGNIGSREKAKYDIIGKNVNLASRIESYSIGGQILISPVTYANLLPDVHTRGEKEIMPKGVKKPIIIYDVEGIGNIMLKKREQHFHALSPIVPISFHIIDGKDIQPEAIPANITHISEDEAVIACCTIDAQSGSSISFSHAGHDVLAKILSIESGRFTAHFTFGRDHLPRPLL